MEDQSVGRAPTVADSKFSLNGIWAEGLFACAAVPIASRASIIHIAIAFIFNLVHLFFLVVVYWIAG
jgi:hypothetical protein